MKLKYIFSTLAILSLSLVACNSPNTENTTDTTDTTATETTTETPNESVANTTEVATDKVPEYEVKNDINFICAAGYDRDTDKRYPTTYAWTPRGKVAIVRWKFPWFESTEWTNETRCEAVSPRFQQAYNEGSMLYFTYAKQNDRPVICTAYEKGGDCATMLFTLRPQDDPIETIADLTDILNGRATGPLQHSSGEKKVYFEITNIGKFLETAPVEKE